MQLKKKGKRQFRLYNYLQYTKKYYFAPDKQSKKLLPSGFTEGQTWGGLEKAWMAFIIAKNNDDLEKMNYYAPVIQKLQHELGIKKTDFPELNLSALGYFADNARYMSENEVKGGNEVIEQMLKEAEVWQKERLKNAKEWTDSAREKED